MGGTEALQLGWGMSHVWGSVVGIGGERVTWVAQCRCDWERAYRVCGAAPL